jgi:hypothetical protein
MASRRSLLKTPRTIPLGCKRSLRPLHCSTGGASAHRSVPPRILLLTRSGQPNAASPLQSWERRDSRPVWYEGRRPNLLQESDCYSAHKCGRSRAVNRRISQTTVYDICDRPAPEFNTEKIGLGSVKSAATSVRKSPFSKREYSGPGKYCAVWWRSSSKVLQLQWHAR